MSYEYECALTESRLFKRDVRRQLAAARKTNEAELVARYRERHPECTTSRDRVVLALAEMAASVGK